jgi:NADP-dependent 3-hydroxy acid dehydrogenase YdfG
VTTTAASPSQPREPELVGQTVVVTGGSSGWDGPGDCSTGTRRRSAAQVMLSGRTPDRLPSAAEELGAIAAFDTYDSASLERFFQALRSPVDHFDGHRRRSLPCAAARDGPPREACTSM